jgi:dihydrolipoamide dehydrogenase
MNKFDLIVIGAGAGLRVASTAAKIDLEVALVDPGPVGGVCLNTGCTPSKILIRPADIVRSLEDAHAVGIEGVVVEKDFQKIMSRMRSFVDNRRRHLEEAIKSMDRITWFKETAEFTGASELKVGDKTLTAPKILIATGARALIPPLPGLKETGYLDHASLLKLDRPPRSIIVIGAGYVGCEYGHFFSAMGTKVTILGRGAEVLNREDPEVCRIIKRALSRYMNVLTGHEALEVKMEGEDGRRSVLARNLNDGRIYSFEADEILVATGRRSNADILKPDKAGVETNDHGWIKTDDYLETTMPGIWAIGDALGRHMFRHTAKYEAEVVSQNMLRAKSKEEMLRVDYHAVPHAVSTYPAVAGVGLKEAEALAAGNKVLVGRVRYTDMAMGYAIAEDSGFIKSVVEEKTGRILGCSIVGSEASSLIQQIVYLMNADHQDLQPMMRSEIIHPALSELLVRAFTSLEKLATPMQHECELTRQP